MIIASIATLASRRHLLEQAVASLLPQVDRLNVYLNGYLRVPPFLLHEKVAHPILSRDAGWRGPEAKWWFVDVNSFAMPPTPAPTDIHLTCDDDIQYPEDYVERMVDALERRPGTIACVHGSIFTLPFRDYISSRVSFRFGEALAEDTRVHVAGSGTIAYELGTLPIGVARDFRWPRMVDPELAVLAKERGVECWAIAREHGWLKYMRPPQGTTIYEQRSAAGNHLAETELVRENGPWPPLPVPNGARGHVVSRASRGRK